MSPIGDDRPNAAEQAGTLPGQLTVTGQATPEGTRLAVDPGVALAIPDAAIVALVGVLSGRLGTRADRSQVQLDELAMLAVSIIEEQVRAGVVARLEELAGRIAVPLGDLALTVRRATDLIETSADPRLPRMADVVRQRLAVVEEIAHELDTTVARSRPVGGAQVSLDLREVVRRAVDLSEPVGRADQVLVDLPVGPVWVCLRPDPAERVLASIVAAARHHAATDRTVRVSLTTPNGRATVCVTSPGPRIPLPDLLRVVGESGVLDADGSPVSVSVNLDGARVQRQGLDVVTGPSGTRFTIRLGVDVDAVHRSASQGVGR